MNYKMTPAQVKSAIREKLSHIYGVFRRERFRR